VVNPNQKDEPGQQQDTGVVADIVMSNVVTYKDGCGKNGASLAHLREFANKVDAEDMSGLEEALVSGKVFAWETGWLGYQVKKKGDDCIFWILSIFNDTKQGKYSGAKDGDWFWPKFVELAKEEKCNKIQFQTKRFGMFKWAGQFGFKVNKIIMEKDL
jgi:hypothetical protein